MGTITVGHAEFLLPCPGGGYFLYTRRVLNRVEQAPIGKILGSRVKTAGARHSCDVVFIDARYDPDIPVGAWVLGVLQWVSR